jgi:KH domain
MLIHQSLAGCVIGKGGGKIKEIKDVSENENQLLKVIISFRQISPSHKHSVVNRSNRALIDYYVFVISFYIIFVHPFVKRPLFAVLLQCIEG